MGGRIAIVRSTTDCSTTVTTSLGALYGASHPGHCELVVPLRRRRGCAWSAEHSLDDFLARRIGLSWAVGPQLPSRHWGRRHHLQFRLRRFDWCYHILLRARAGLRPACTLPHPWCLIDFQWKPNHGGKGP